MRLRSLWLLLCLLVPLKAHIPEVQERCLRNGLRVLVVSRPGCGAVHARWGLRGGTADTGALPPVAAEVLAHALFRAPAPGDLGRASGIETLLEAEEGAYEALRLARLRHDDPDEGSEPTLEALQAHHASIWARLDEALGSPREGEVWAVHVEADVLSGSVDLPASGLEAWLAREVERFRNLTLASFPWVRETLRKRLLGSESLERQLQEALLAAALPGEAYGRTMTHAPEVLDGLGWSALRSWARTVVVPERLTLVLVGEVDLERLMPTLEKTLGTWSVPLGTGPERPLGALEGSGARRLQVRLAVDPQVLLAWRIPSGTHPDHVTLELVARTLQNRLQERLQGSERRVAKEIEVLCGLPGVRDPALFVVRAHSVPGQSLEALEEALRSEQIRLQRDVFSEDDLRRAQRQLEAAELHQQEGASSLALALIRAQVQRGDWHRAFRFRSLGQDVELAEVQRVVRTYLIPERLVTVVVEQDPLVAPQDALEVQLLKVLRTLIQDRVGNPAHGEAILRETLQQFRMLTRSERESMLRLLQGQVKR